MKLFIALFAGLCLFTINGTAQNPVLRFDTVYHNFGSIPEDTLTVSCRFNFTNTGPSNLKLTKVQTSCGCTTSNWSTDSIKPGKTGHVDATYNLIHRPGPFFKTISVYSNSSTDPIVLKISGMVVRKYRTMKDSFMYQLGNICFVKNVVDFHKLTNDVTDTVMTLPIMNASDTAITITGFLDKGNDFISVKGLPLTIQPHAMVLLPVHYNPMKINDYGRMSSAVAIVTTDSKKPEKKIFVYADIHQYVPKMSAREMSNIPRLMFKDSIYDFGDIKQGDVKSIVFAFKNGGKTNLKIYRVKSSCGCTVPELAKSELAPGEACTMNVKFDSKDKKGAEEKQITIYSNDPVNPEYVLKVRSNVIANQ